MLTLTNFLTVAGAAAITTALVALLKAMWKAAPGGMANEDFRTCCTTGVSAGA